MFRIRPVLATLLVILQLVIYAPGGRGDERARVLGELIFLEIPAHLPAKEVRALLDNREQAMDFALSYFDCTLTSEPTVRIGITLLGGGELAGIAACYNLSLREYLTLPSLVEAEELSGCYGEVHLVTDRCWEIRSTALAEGIAGYVDSEYRQDATYHEVALGLLARGELRPLESLLKVHLSRRPTAQDQLAIQSGGASFVAFLMDRFGIDDLEEFSSLCWKATPLLEEDTQRLFGRSLSQLENEWHAHVEQNASASAHACALFVDAVAQRLSGPEAVANEIDELWVYGRPLKISHSEVCEAVLPNLTELAREILFAASNEEADTAFEKHQAALHEGERLFAEWLAAAEAFRLALVGERDRDEVAQLLNRAEAGYLAVGDYNMLEAVHTAWDELVKNAEP